MEWMTEDSNPSRWIQVTRWMTLPPARDGVEWIEKEMDRLVRVKPFILVRGAGPSWPAKYSLFRHSTWRDDSTPDIFASEQGWMQSAKNDDDFRKISLDELRDMIEPEEEVEQEWLGFPVRYPLGNCGKC